MKISIVIPTYEQRGLGVNMLARCLETIKQQTCKPYEVIISDNSKDHVIDQMCAKFQGLPIIYQRNPVIGHCENFNFALDLVTGTHVKLMCQDDLFYQRASLGLFARELEHHAWVVSSSVHIDERGRTLFRKNVRYDPNQWDKNITGMPSVVAYRVNELRFDTRLRTYCDLWLYRQLYDKFGMPAFIKEWAIGQRFWRYSASRTIPGNHVQDRLLIQKLLENEKPHNMQGLRVDGPGKVPGPGQHATQQ